jgi:hypothetical protein
MANASAAKPANRRTIGAHAIDCALARGRQCREIRPIRFVRPPIFRRQAQRRLQPQPSQQVREQAMCRSSALRLLARLKRELSSLRRRAPVFLLPRWTWLPATRARVRVQPPAPVSLAPFRAI